MMKATVLLTVMLLSISFMGCLEPEDKRSIITEEAFENRRLAVSEDQLSQFPYSLEPIRNFTVVKPDDLDSQITRMWAVYGTEDIRGNNEHN